MSRVYFGKIVSSVSHIIGSSFWSISNLLIKKRERETKRKREREKERKREREKKQKEREV